MNLFGIELPQELILFYLCILLVLVLIFSISALFIALKNSRKMKRVLRDGAGNDITEAIVNYYKKCTQIMDDYKKADERLQNLERNMNSCAKKIGAIRYNAFGGNNANLSYAVAVLDDSDSGFVLNGVYSRGQTATYLKPITNGRSLFELSEEELEAINSAQLNYEKNISENYKRKNETGENE